MLGDVRPCRPCCLYLLICQSGRSYIGISEFPAVRLQAHQAGRGSFFTRLNRPAALHHLVWLPSRKIAAHLEWRLKRKRRSAKLAWFAAMADTSPSQPASLEAACEALERCSRTLRGDG
ncbi:GIY-YIG nuclease family protein [Roseateles sp. L2-2]|uniref:GIY-YIG nuclease family protein n=1 Tax=Roseateles sp. L2-2 TaxID=3422597 RepID=UPI003D363FF2